MKKVLIVFGLSLVLIITILAMLGWNGYKKSMEVKSIQYDNNLIILEGGGGNSIILTSEDGNQVLVVDTKMGNASKNLRASINAKDITIVNTHLHRDHVDGNKLFPNATIIAGAYTEDQWKSLAGKNRYPDKVIQPGKEIVINIGSEVVRICNMGIAHTWNDVIVYLQNRKLLVTGDLVFHHMHPGMFVQGGSNAALWIAAIDSLLIRYGKAEEILPGHGALSDRIALMDMKEYFLTIEDAIGNQDKIKIA